VVYIPYPQNAERTAAEQIEAYISECIPVI
jgi:hypothetical protein